MCPPPERNDAVVVVDPLSTGALLSTRAFERGLHVIRLWSAECPPDLRTHTAPGTKDCFAITLEHLGATTDAAALETTASRLLELPFTIVAVLCGSEPGVNLTDALSARMGMRGNGTDLSHVRRNKYNQSEAVRSAGHRAVKQVLTTSVDGARSFLEDLAPSPFKAIVKPVESAGSEDVRLCYSVEEVCDHVQSVLGKKNALGIPNDAVLVQEFLEGVEYIVDFVSRDGVHKCTAVWAYDKRPANGGSFVYFGQRPMSNDSPVARKLMAYTANVITALGITNGATHSEVIIDANGEPCLVECNCRLHGGNGEWEPVIGPLLGYSQVSALLDAFLDGPAFNVLPMAPQPFKRFGMLCFLVSYKEGVLVAAPGMYKLRQMRSHIRAALELKVGEHIVKTVNVFTEAGVAALLHDDVNVVEEDYELLHKLCADDDFLLVEGDDATIPVESKAAARDEGLACAKAQEPRVTAVQELAY